MPISFRDCIRDPVSRAGAIAGNDRVASMGPQGDGSVAQAVTLGSDAEASYDGIQGSPIA
jgi:hypothetical protein